MAYSDYTRGQVGPGLSQMQVIPRPRTSPGGLIAPPDEPGLEQMEMRSRMPGLETKQQPVAPDANGTLPTNTRQQALENVQQAYAGRMPGNMDALNSALGNFAQPVGLTDPGIAPALRAGAGADQRSFERQRAALAELLGAQGLGDSGGFNTQVLGIGQKIGEAGAARDAGLVYNEMGNRRNALLSALGMDQQRYGYDNDLAFRLAQLEAQLNSQALAPFLTY